MSSHKPLLAALAATVFLGALVASASAGNLSSSTTSIEAHWNRMNFAGGFGTIECEVDLAGTLHARTFTKIAGALLGVVTAANIPRCTRGGFTVLRETLPWHLTYRSFVGTLPNITAMATNLIGYSFRMREPSFGATCLARSTTESPSILTYNREAGGTITSITAGGTIPCRGAVTVTGTISGNSSSVSAGSLTLI